MNWALTADGMAYVPKHRAAVRPDTCSGRLQRPLSARPAPCGWCADYPGRHRADVPAVTR